MVASPAAAMTAPPVARTAEVQAQIDALLAFRAALVDPYTAMSGWNASSPSEPCSWRGVACASAPASAGHVIELQLPRLRLSGPVSPALGSLPYLQKLSLRSNALTGAIPPALARLTALRAVFLQGLGFDEAAADLVLEGVGDGEDEETVAAVAAGEGCGLVVEVEDAGRGEGGERAAR